jgi:UDP-galactopyranose mutase
MKKDFLIVGAGFFGATIAHSLALKGFSVLVIDRRSHIGGNAYTEEVNGIDIHKYGAHIFHTNNRQVWEFVTQFGDFNNYRHRVIARNGDKVYPMPINLMTFHKMYGVSSPQEARKKLEEVSGPFKNLERTVESWCLANIGPDLYTELVRDYTQKHWQRSPRDLPESIIRRLPVRFDFNSSYFNDVYQGIPCEGYTSLFKNMLDHENVEVRVATPMPKDWERHARHLIYSGRPDELLDFRYGELPYLSLDFKHLLLPCEDYQGTSVVNFTGADVEHTRTIEHKHFNDRGTKSTWVTREFPAAWHRDAEPYYPVVQKKNIDLYSRYRKAISGSNITLGGRLGSYQYFDMHQVVAQALSISRRFNR